MADAIVIGAGHNGLVAANLLLDAGWDVLVLEAEDEPGGAVRSAELTEPGFRHDVFSSFYPLAAASPVLRALDLEAHGLRWCRAPLVLAHPLHDGRCAVLSTDRDETRARLEAFGAGDGAAWDALVRLWERLGDTLMGALATPFPPVRAGVRLARLLGRDLPRFARLLALPVRRLAEERFRGEGGGLLLAGNALHSDLAPESAGSAALGWALSGLGQVHGFPVPRGGAGALTAALCARLEAGGGQLRCASPVSAVRVRGGRACGVVTADGRRWDARRAVLAAIDAHQLFTTLVDPRWLPARFRADLRRFQLDQATFKVDWALDAPVPWEAEDARRAGTVHVAGSLDELTDTAAQIARGLLPARPFLVVGQMTTADATRSPPGTETLWAYASVPQRVRGDAAGALSAGWDRATCEAFAERIEQRIEALAPGFTTTVRHRHLLPPPALEARDRSLAGGGRYGGTAQLHQQLVLRPTPGFGRPSTPVRDLYLASASAHPGGGVHGACGANAAIAALRARRRRHALLAAGAAGALAVARRR